MVIVDEQIVLLSITQQADAEQTVVVDVEGHDERGLHGLNVFDGLDSDGKTVTCGNSLERLAVVIKGDTGE